MSNEEIKHLIRKCGKPAESLFFNAEKQQKYTQQQGFDILLQLLYISRTFGGLAPMFRYHVEVSHKAGKYTEEEYEILQLLIHQLFSVNKLVDSAGRENHQHFQDLMLRFFVPEKTLGENQKKNETILKDLMLLPEHNKLTQYSDELRIEINSSLGDVEKGAVMCAVIQYFTKSIIMMVQHICQYGVDEKGGKLFKGTPSYVLMHLAQPAQIGFHLLRVAANQDRVRCQTLIETHAPRQVEKFNAVFNAVEKLILPGGDFPAPQSAGSNS